ncbi:MAG: chromosomal replication initiator protein DnaA [Bacteroidetes bacterium CG12_big_fil_rev_8_21_14_0_65_60_17]|nr:MAG: chromosomal replication initiator protein DnaA [Bacteroidetes bacterium CG12_big_fil_rev_8_21_14_0_65_60_17]
MPNAAPRTLNPNYTFDSFIEADCNRLARSAGVAVSEQPGVTSFNPFLIYGRVGLGKTHLAHAIGNAIVGSGPRTSVLYMTSEAFTNCFVQAIQNNTLGEFTTTFREIDVLIVDDIQFFGGKEKTQEQFFHLFNDLHQRGKQIVLCADRSPAEIDGIEERLLSRFRWGLSADVQPPDLETRTAILQSHCKRSGLELSHDIVDYIAYNVRDNIRLLEGAFNRLYALNRMTSQELTLPFVQDALADLIQARVRKTISAREIRDIVAEYYSLDPAIMAGKSRKRHIVDARQTAMHFCKALTQLSLEAIGKQFGGRDHSTVIHACKAVQARLDTDVQYRSELAAVERLLTQRIVHA